MLGIGFGWNREEAADHGVDFADRRAVAREHVLCMQALWRDDPAEFHGVFVDLDPCWSRPKPVQRPGVPVLLGGAATAGNFAAIAEYADGWMPIGGSGLGEALPAAAPGLRGPRAGPRHGAGGPVRDRSRPRPNSTTSPTSASTRWCCGYPPGPAPRSWRYSTPMPSTSHGSAVPMTDADGGGGAPESPRREGPLGRPWSGGGREELAAAVRRLDGAHRHVHAGTGVLRRRRGPDRRPVRGAGRRPSPTRAPSRSGGSPGSRWGPTTCRP